MTTTEHPTVAPLQGLAREALDVWAGSLTPRVLDSIAAFFGRNAHLYDAEAWATFLGAIEIAKADWHVKYGPAPPEY